jgi:subtilisin family serine protease
LKPDISAPGVSVESSISQFTDGTYSYTDSVVFMGTTYYFDKWSGTSMASPVCAGIAALVIEANPFLSASQVKTIILNTARKDNFTGTSPHSNKWGWGKINAYDAVKLALTMVGLENMERKNDWKLYPNPAENQIWIEGLEGELLELNVIDLNGKKVLEDLNANQIDVSNLSAGTYILRFVYDGKVSQQKFVKQ